MKLKKISRKGYKFKIKSIKLVNIRQENKDVNIYNTFINIFPISITKTGKVVRKGKRVIRVIGSDRKHDDSKK